MGGEGGDAYVRRRVSFLTATVLQNKLNLFTVGTEPVAAPGFAD